MISQFLKNRCNLQTIALYFLLSLVTVNAQIPSGYYEDAAGKTGSELKAALNTIVNTGFQLKTYGEARYILDETDQDPNNPGNVILVYLGTSISSIWDSGETWNREHIWPQSLLGEKADNDKANVCSDLHNLKPAEPGENSSRGNKYYDNQTTSDSYAPRNEIRGDLARILFYMVIAYESAVLDLELVNQNPGLHEMALLSALLEWHTLDPVDDFERNRNEVIYSYQNNRNPFIDHPEYADRIWNDTLTIPTDHTIMTYNLQNWGEEPGDDNNRKDDLRLVIESVQPDIFIAEEVWNTGGYNDILQNILNPSNSQWEGCFIDQSVDQDIVVYYKPEYFTHISTQLVECSHSDYLRDALEVKLRDKSMGTEFYVYGIHLKANDYSGDNSDNISIRAHQAGLLRAYLNELPDSSYFILAGDLNMLNASESGWLNLTKSQSDNSGRVFDPVDQVGEWDDNPDFALYHSYSTRYYSHGLHSRLDFILISDAVRLNPLVNYITDTYKAYGNDGKHFGDSVNWDTNTAVSSSVADALYNVSDHLPVIARFDFSGIDTVYQPEIANLFFSEYIEGSNYNKALEIYNAMDIPINLTGYSIISSVNGGSWKTSRYDFPGDAVLEPEDVWVIANADAEQTVLDVADEVLSTSAAGYVVGFNGNDVKALVKIIASDTTFLDIIGLYPDPYVRDGWAVAGIADATANHTLVRKTTVTTGNPDWTASAGSNSEDSEWTVYTSDTFDYLGAHPGKPPSFFRPDNLYNQPASYRLYACYPNPFNPTTTIRYDLPAATDVTLQIFNLRGELVRTLIRQPQTVGSHQVVWNGLNENGQSVAGGIYIYRMLTATGYHHSEKMILLK